MAKTLNEQVRDFMLQTIKERADGGDTNALRYVHLIHSAGDDQYDFGLQEITWSSANNGEIQQDGTISTTQTVDMQDQTTDITGFEFYEGDNEDLTQNTKTGEGEFATSVTLEPDSGGTEYTIYISGITISIPENGS